MSKTGKFYGIGIGPGDPELITLKAINTLSRVDVVVAPVGKKDSIALKIAKPYIKTKVIKQDFPMTYDKDTLKNQWDENVSEIKELLDMGLDVAFITLGDPMIYSTYSYIIARLQGVDIKTIPGITSFCAVASRVNSSIAEGDMPFVVLTVKDAKSVEEVLNDFDSVVLMKVSRNYDDIVEVLKEKGFKASLVIRCGQEGEEVIQDLEKYKGKKIDYLSLIVARREDR